MDMGTSTESTVSMGFFVFGDEHFETTFLINHIFGKIKIQVTIYFERNSYSETWRIFIDSYKPYKKKPCFF